LEPLAGRGEPVGVGRGKRARYKKTLPRFTRPPFDKISAARQPLVASDWAVAWGRIRRMLREENQIVLALMGRFMVVMLDVLGDGMIERSLAEEDHAVEALVFNGPD
jgi:hypothetical protein